MRFFGFNPQQVRTVLQRGDAVQHHAVYACAFFELEKVARQAGRFDGFTVGVHNHVSGFDLAQVGNFFAVQEAVVLVAQISRP